MQAEWERCISTRWNLLSDEMAEVKGAIIQLFYT